MRLSAESVSPPLPQKKGLDYVLLGSAVALVLFGLLMVYSASFIYAQEKLGDGMGLIRKQTILASFGLFALWLASLIDYRFWYRAAYPFLGLALVLVAGTYVPGLGAKAGGAQRWLKVAGFYFQPSELAKFAVIFFVARQLYRKRDRLNRFIPGVLAPLLVPAPVFLLLLQQPDFGTVAMTSGVIVFLMFIGGVRPRFLGTSLAVLVSLGSFLVLSTPYRRERLLGFLDPWQDPAGRGFQILQSLLGFYNGKIFGVGLGNGKEKLFYLPEAHNDFIFAVIGEELGFVGVLGLISAFAFFTFRGLQIAKRAHDEWGDSFGMLLASGATLALGLQAFVNMAVVLGLVPTKGLTLPFISYGGSSLVVDLFAVGVILAVGRGPRSARWEIRE